MKIIQYERNDKGNKNSNVIAKFNKICHKV